MTCKSSDNDSGMSVVIGLLLITAIVVVSSVIVFAVVNAYEVKRPVIANIEIENIDLSNYQEITLMHKGGDSFNVSEIKIVVSVNGKTLNKNLNEFPTFGASGFNYVGGVFHKFSHDNNWDSGDCGFFSIAKNNAILKSGDHIEITIIHRATGTIISSPTTSI